MNNFEKKRKTLIAIVDEVHELNTNEYAFNKIVGPFYVNVIES